MHQTITLANGLRIILEEMPFIRSITFGIWIKNGSRNEEAETNGISHFIEHMLFKGTDTRTAKRIADEMDAIGGQLNAYTTKEYTCYFARMLDTHFDTGLDILSDMILHPRFDEEDIQKERNVILEEINMYEDSPEEAVHDILEYHVFSGASLGRPILGTKESISAFTRQTFLTYYESHYHPQNMVVAVSGNFKTDEMVKKIEAKLGPLTRPAPYNPPVFHTSFKPSVIKKEKDIEQVHISIGFPGIPLGTEYAYALSALNTIFGGGMSSRLFQSIREEKGLTYAIYSYNSSYQDCGICAVYAALNADQTETVLQLIKEEIVRLTTDPISQAQLLKTREQMKSNYIMSLENSANRMSSLGRTLLMLNRILTPDETIEKVDQITLKDIHHLVETLFDFNQMSISAVGNVSGLTF